MNSSVVEQKQALRKEVRARKRGYTPAQLEEMSSVAIAKLDMNPLFQSAQRVMLYHPLPDEVDTRSLIEKYADEKEIILPTVVGDDIVPVVYSCEDILQQGAFSIWEPCSEPYLGAIDLIVVPGMAFDNAGHRLGRGKGFYDRFLEKHPDAATIGLCFDFQLFDEIPTECFDKPVSILITS